MRAFCVRGSRLSLIVGFAVLLTGLAAPSGAMAQREPRPPRLVVIVVVDQFRADFLTRYEHLFTSGGFRRLMDNGAHFANAYYSYATTSTAPGHATIATGRLPRQHGIVANEWIPDRSAGTARASVYDPDVKLLSGQGGRTEGRSPRHLIGPALGDQMKLSNRQTRVFSVALKDRAAILLGGQKPDGAFWWDTGNGQFITSTWYMRELPVYVREFNTQRWADRFVNGRWDRLLPAGAYAGTHPLEPEWVAGEGVTPEFPHLLPRVSGQPGKDFYTAVYATPFGNEVVLEMARRILDAERLGRGDATDLLCIGLSSFDPAGHVFGPDSAEMLDFTVRTDQHIAALLDLLERAVGLKRCLVVLTADHGVVSAARLARKLGVGGGRIDLAAATRTLNRNLKNVATLPDNRDAIASVSPPWVYMDAGVGSLPPESRIGLAQASLSFLRGLEGIEEIYTAEELAGPSPLPGETQRYLAWRSYHPRRAGDLFIHLAPYWAPRDAGFADHGTGYNHDRHVPIVFMGGGMRAGRYFSAADPMDIAPTIAALLGIEPPLDASGRVLNEALDPSAVNR